MNNIKPFFLFLVIGVIMSILFSSGQIENPDTHLRLTQTRILFETFKFGLPNDVGEVTHGNIAINNAGKRFMAYNPGQTLFFVPIYYLAKFLTISDGECYYKAAFFVSFINFFIHALCAFILFKIAQALGATTRKSYFLSVVFCFTSYSFSFAQCTYEHHFEMLFILLGYYFIISTNNNSKAVFAGISITLGLIFRNTTILAIPGILFLADNNKQRIYFTLFCLPGMLSILIYNYYRFGNPLESGYTIAWHIAHRESIVFWSLERIPRSLFGFILSPAKGLLIFSPTIVISLWGITKFWNKYRRFTLSIVAICAFYLLLYSMNFAWHGSIWSFGPRYILPIVPLLYIPIIEVNIKKWIYSLLILSALGQILLISVNYKRDLLEQYISYNGIDEQQYIYGIGNIPYLIQFKQLVIILPKNVSGKLENYFPNSPWKKEIRMASSHDDLNNSIENNSINFWWVRIFQWKTTRSEKVITIILLMLAFLGSILTSRYAKKNIQ
ncbi:MAG: hypothetical protein HXX13_11160 [Bacteroidetes bacterium]|nr:hypothetical protein [Bacteroidota bacterium]